jgi:hypothetical protein
MPTILLLALLAPACVESSARPVPRLWTMADLQRSWEEAKLLEPCDNPAGLECGYFVSDGVTGTDILHLKLSFSEGAPVAYITTDFWRDYDQIWLQPMYFLVTSWDPENPGANRLLKPDGTVTGPIFGVGPGSAFYSPYWQVYYVEVPLGTPPTKYTAARPLFEDHRVMHLGANRYASIGPATVSVPQEADVEFFRPYLDDPTQLADVIASARQLKGWLDGTSVVYVDFGIDGFAANGANVVQDIPLFAFEQEVGGALQLLSVPFVGGVAPLFSGIGGEVGSDNRPHFGGLWRIHFVTLPAGARAFADTDEAALGLTGQEKYFKRVALNADQCLASAGAFPSCIWLDSQAQIENNIGPRGIERTTLQPACPFVAWDGAPVPNP